MPSQFVCIDLVMMSARTRAGIVIKNSDPYKKMLAQREAEAKHLVANSEAAKTSSLPSTRALVAEAQKAQESEIT